jgi:hypothetical protein
MDVTDRAEAAPPTWMQAFMQQMTERGEHTQAQLLTMQQQSTAQNERIEQLEALLQLQQAAPPQTEERTPTTTDENPPMVEAEAPTVSTRRPRARLPDPPLFGGNRVDWPAWRITMENKLAEDAQSIGDTSSQFRYVFSRLEKTAWKNMATFVRESGNQGTPAELLQYLERVYGDPNLTARAAQRLQTLRQGERVTFPKFLPILEKEFADAGALAWPNDTKRSILLATLNRTMKTQLMHRGVPDDFNDIIARLHQISTDLDLLEMDKDLGQGRQFPRSAHPTPRATEEIYDPMDWTPTPVRVNAAGFQGPPNPNGYPSTRPEDQDLIGKRAKWVPQEELDRRRQENRCMRCGRHRCRFMQCPLRPAINPNRSQPQSPRQSYRGPRVNTASVEDPKTITEPTPKKRPSTRVARVEEHQSSDEETEQSENE